MPRPFRSTPPPTGDSPPPSASMNATGTASGTASGTTGTGATAGTGDAAGFLQQLHQRLRTRCCAGNSVANAGETRCAASSPDRTTHCFREVPASVNAVGMTLPSLLQTWRRRIDCMADREEQHKPDAAGSQGGHDRHRHHHHHHHRAARCHRQRRGDRSVERSGEAALSPPESTASSSSNSSSSGEDGAPSPPPPHPPCLFGGFELPKLLHPRLERQRACASLSGLWDSPLSSPDAGGSPTPPRPSWGPRCHPYCRSGGGDASSPAK